MSQFGVVRVKTRRVAPVFLRHQTSGLIKTTKEDLQKLEYKVQMAFRKIKDLADVASISVKSWEELELLNEKRKAVKEDIRVLMIQVTERLQKKSELELRMKKQEPETIEPLWKLPQPSAHLQSLSMAVVVQADRNFKRLIDPNIQNTEWLHKLLSRFESREIQTLRTQIESMKKEAQAKEASEDTQSRIKNIEETMNSLKLELSKLQDDNLQQQQTIFTRDAEISKHEATISKQEEVLTQKNSEIQTLQLTIKQLHDDYKLDIDKRFEKSRRDHKLDIDKTVKQMTDQYEKSWEVERERVQGEIDGQAKEHSTMIEKLAGVAIGWIHDNKLKRMDFDAVATISPAAVTLVRLWMDWPIDLPTDRLVECFGERFCMTREVILVSDGDKVVVFRPVAMPILLTILPNEAFVENGSKNRLDIKLNDPNSIMSALFPIMMTPDDAS